jgi:hypothetical protein
LRRHCFAGAERRGDGVSLEGSSGAESPNPQSGAQILEGAFDGKRGAIAINISDWPQIAV